MALSYLVDRRNAFNTPWNAERDALLAQMWADGYSASQIANQIKDVVVSRMAVIGRAHRLKLPPRRPRKRNVRPVGQRETRVRLWKPKPEPKPRPVANGAPTVRMLTLFQLKPSSCRWPIGDGPFLFCGADADRDEVYCPFHQRIARVR